MKPTRNSRHPRGRRSLRLRPNVGFCLVQLLIAVPLGIAPSEAGAQARSSTPYLRELHIDPLLLDAGIDSVQFRAALSGLLREARRSDADVTAATPALDITIFLPRVGGQPPDARPLLHIEIGRNLIEQGVRSRVLWERSLTLAEYATWRAAAAAATLHALDVVRAYLRQASEGA